MNFPLLKVVSVPDELPQSDPIAELRAQRDELAAQLGAVSAKLSRLNAAVAGQSAAQNALDALAAAELASWEEFLSSPSSGLPEPQPDMETRARLNHELATASILAATQRQAAENLHAEHGDLSSRLADIGSRLEALALDHVVKKFETDLASLARFAEEVQSRQAKVWSCSVFLRQLAERYMASRPEKGLAIYRRLEQIVLPEIELQPSAADVAAKAPVWREMLERLINE